MTILSTTAWIFLAVLLGPLSGVEAANKAVDEDALQRFERELLLREARDGSVDADSKSSSLRGVMKASFLPQSLLTDTKHDSLRNLKKNKEVEERFDPVEDAIKNLNKKEEKKSRNSARRRSRKTRWTRPLKSF